ncbi:WecB/TagA/CpsF family glycosyltransferase [Prevotella koreensis]|uniref:WecB/TagA/CpsF family glycosyltransferase n=1 Tax=Prevotella koreensis TaxID=2490854 RepID=UPI00193AC6E2|nr:WecB/TagA/CpsF family glycosyltransferase [Prevotella koreensis]
MIFRLKTLDIIESKGSLSTLPIGKCLINTINAHSYNTAQKDALFAEALLNGDALIPDGASIVKACKWLNAKSQPRERIAGWDLFVFEMRRLNDEQLRVGSNVQAANVNSEPNDDRKQPKVMFMGSSEKVLELIREKAKREYPNLETVTYSPPYKPEFSDEDNAAIVKAINDADPDLLWIGMTAPKQEKWVYKHWHELDINCHCGTIGAVFDFFAGTTKRAPLWWQEHSLEWLYRLIIEPRRMWRRYIIGNALFLWNIIKEKA